MGDSWGVAHILNSQLCGRNPCLFRSTRSWEKRANCSSAHLPLLELLESLKDFRPALSFFGSYGSVEGPSLCRAKLLLVAVQSISLLGPLKHIRPVWVCLLKHKGEYSNDRVVSVWGNLSPLSPVASSSSITFLARSKSLMRHTYGIMLLSANMYVSIASLRS